MHTLRDFGFGKTEALQVLAPQEFEEVKAQFEQAIETNHGVLSPSKLFLLAAFNLTWVSIAGRRVQPDEQRVLRLMHHGGEVFTKITYTSQLLGAFPVLANVLPTSWRSSGSMAQINEESRAYLKVKICSQNTALLLQMPMNPV